MDDLPELRPVEIITSNVLADLAERIRILKGEADEAAQTAIERTLECGGLLVEAKSHCSHGEWLPFLKRAGINERYAQRAMKLVEAGLDFRHVSDLGGIRGALDYLAEPKLPEEGQCLFVENEIGDRWGYVWESADYPGYFHFCMLHDLGTYDGATLTYSKRPMLPDRVEYDGKQVNFFWQTVRQEFQGGKLTFISQPIKEPGLIEHCESCQRFDLKADVSARPAELSE